MPDQPDSHQRTVLPISDRPYTGLVTYDAEDPDTKFPPIAPLRPPAGAPNMLLILLDDTGFGASSAFGGLPGAGMGGLLVAAVGAVLPVALHLGTHRSRNGQQPTSRL